jgi:hypothetical protein
MHNFSSKTSAARICEAKRRVIDRLSRLSMTELRKESRAASMLTWGDIIDLFVLRAKISAPKKGTLAYFIVNNGLKLGRFLDRIRNKPGSR